MRLCLASHSKDADHCSSCMLPLLLLLLSHSISNLCVFDNVDIVLLVDVVCVRGVCLPHVSELRGALHEHGPVHRLLWALVLVLLVLCHCQSNALQGNKETAVQLDKVRACVCVCAWNQRRQSVAFKRSHHLLSSFSSSCRPLQTFSLSSHKAGTHTCLCEQSVNCNCRKSSSQQQGMPPSPHVRSHLWHFSFPFPFPFLFLCPLRSSFRLPPRHLLSVEAG